MNRRKFIKTSAVGITALPLINVTDLLKEKDFYKTPKSIFTFGEIDDFCKEWGWIHIKKFIKQTQWLCDHKSPYCWSTYGQGQFEGIDGNKYMTWGTYRTQWIGSIKTDPKNKEEFKGYLKKIAGDYYGPPKREHYYFYDVLFTGGDPYNAWWMKEFDPKFEPNEYGLKSHGQPYWNVTLWHLGVTDGKEWKYVKSTDLTFI